MLQRKTQTPVYWEQNFAVTPDDIEHLYRYVLERAVPVAIEELTLELVRHRCQQEEQLMRAELTRGVIYQPKGSYAIGDQVVFPAFDYRLGVVRAIRQGHNPEHGEFNVIAVQLEGEDTTREFAADLKTPHRLNQTDNGEELWKSANLIPPEELAARHRERIRSLLVEALQHPDSGFVSHNDQWFLKALLVDVHVGYLNLAEALIEVKGQPLSVQSILAELDMPAEAPEEIRTFSLNFALSQDERFDLIRSREGDSWMLRRLEPPAALSTPPSLVYTPVRYNRALLTVEMLQVEWELDDEWSEGGITTESAFLVPTTTLVLTYPHRKAGTLPLSPRSRPFFPAGDHGRGMITFIDGRWGQRFSGWVVYDGRYVCGLEGWMEQHKLPVGAYITLERTARPDEVAVDFRPRRMRREWVRMASVEDGQLVLRMQKQPIACEYDEHVLLGEESPEDLEALRTRLAEEGATVADLLHIVFPELVKLNPQGTVHVKSLYSAVNMLRRTAPGPIFAALLADRSFRDVGGGYYALSVQ